MSTNLNDVRKQLAAKKKEMEELKKQERALKVAPKVSLLTDAILNDDEACEVLDSFTNDEVRALAAQLVKSFGDIVEEAGPELEEIRQKKAEKEARRKARKTQGNTTAAHEYDDSTESETESVNRPYMGGNNSQWNGGI